MLKRHLFYLFVALSFVQCEETHEPDVVTSPMEIGSNCLLAMIEELDFNGDPSSQTSFEYDQQNRISTFSYEFRTSTFTYADDQLIEICTEDTYINQSFCEQLDYHPDGTLKSYRTFLGTRDGIETWSTSYYFHYPDSLVVRDSLGTTTSKYFLNSDGRPSRYESYDALFGLASWADYEYDARRNRTDQRSWFVLRGRVVHTTNTYNTALKHVQEQYWNPALIRYLLFPQNVNAISSVTSTGGTVNFAEEYRYQTVNPETVEVYRTVSYLNDPYEPSEVLWKRYTFECN